MTKTIKAIAIALASFAAANTASAQSATASANSHARIIIPLSISCTADLEFGYLATTGTAGNVVLTTAGVRNPTNVILPFVTGTVNAAGFSVTGEGGQTFYITLPASATLSDGGANTMGLSSFTSSVGASSVLSGIAGSLGGQTFTVGATLAVAATQPAGWYALSNTGGSGNFPVTVNY